VLDRFTKTSRDIVTRVKDIALSLNHDKIHNEHILHEIIKGENLALSVITEIQPSFHLIERDMNILLKKLSDRSDDSIGFDDFVKKSIEKAFLETETLNYKWISSLMILLGMFESGSEVSVQLLTSWGLDPVNLKTRIQEIGDISGADETPFKLDSRDSIFAAISSKVDEDLDKVLTHAMELARTYKTNTVNFYHILLSLVFLSVRQVIDVAPIDTGRFNLEHVKEIVADRMAGESEFTEGILIFSNEIHRIFKYATQESYLTGLKVVSILPFVMSMAYNFPAEIKNSTGYDLLEMKWNIGNQKEVSGKQNNVSPEPTKATTSITTFPQISLRRYNADRSAVIMIPKVLAEEWGVIAVDSKDDILTVAMIDPENEETVQKLIDLTHMQIAIVKTEERDLRAAFRINY